VRSADHELVDLGSSFGQLRLERFAFFCFSLFRRPFPLLFVLTTAEFGLVDFDPQIGDVSDQFKVLQDEQ
jgi:hypothetical protein